MDPWRIALRALFAFAVLFVLMRLNTKRTIKQDAPFGFTLALILGDLVDDPILAEVPVRQFVVAAGTLLATHVVMDRLRHRGTWR